MPNPPLETIINSLDSVSRLWLDHQDAIRREGVSALKISTGFNVSMIEAALNAAFEELTDVKLMEFCRTHPLLWGGSSRAPKKVLHILAGNVFTSWVPGAVVTLLLDAECTLKPSSSEPVFAPLWRRSVSGVDALLGMKIHVASWSDQLLAEHDAVVAYGSDETIAKLRKMIPPPGRPLKAGLKSEARRAWPGGGMSPSTTRFIGYGHKFSVAVVFKEALVMENRVRLMEQIRCDSEPFNGQGCLSPRIIYVEEGKRGQTPFRRGGLTPFQEGPGPTIKPFADWPALKQELETFRPHLSALGYAGPEFRVDAIQSDLEGLGFTRICPLGEMQQPPLAWRNGGIDLVEELLKG